jgi:hypothetical protein
MRRAAILIGGAVLTHDHEWGEDSEACCVKCEWRGTVKELIEIDDDEDEEEPPDNEVPLGGYGRQPKNEGDE